MVDSEEVEIVPTSVEELRADKSGVLVEQMAALDLAGARGAHALADAGVALGVAALVEEYLVRYVRDLDRYVDAVQERAGNPGAVAFNPF